MLVTSAILGLIFRICLQSIFFRKLFKKVPYILVVTILSLSAFTGNPNFSAFIVGAFVIEMLDSFFNFAKRVRLNEAKKAYKQKEA